MHVKHCSKTGWGGERGGGGGGLQCDKGTHSATWVNDMSKLWVLVMHAAEKLAGIASQSGRCLSAAARRPQPQVVLDLTTHPALICQCPANAGCSSSWLWPNNHSSFPSIPRLGKMRLQQQFPPASNQAAAGSELTHAAAAAKLG